MSTYNYTISVSFGGTTPNYNQLHTEITNDVGIAPTLTGINSNGDNVDITFGTALSAGEQTTLDGLVSAHSPTNTSSLITNIPTNTNSVNSTNYVTILTFNFPGTNKLQNITNIKFIGYMDEGGTSYTAKLFDLTNNNVIATATYSNTGDSICDMGTLTNLPTGEAIFELQLKVTGTTNAIIKNINIRHD